MIGHVEAINELYYVDALGKSFFAIITDSIYKIWLHHKRFGHPSFSILKVMFPLLFKNSEYESLQWDICEFA